MSLPKTVEELSFETILNNKKAKLQEKLPETYNNLIPSDPAIALLEVSSYTEGMLRNRLNNTLLAVMLDYAADADLDNLGRLYGIERKLIHPADNTTTPPTPAV
ncbi:MAG: hypothetical protein LBQ34_03850 [Alphaproteobacteria bacterium]|nr:hypothetical protein [Alphaproteobacteria bacterium]